MGRGLVEPVDDLRATNPPTQRPAARRPGRRLPRSRVRPEAAAPHDLHVARLWPQLAAQRAQRRRPAELLAALPHAAAGRSAARRRHRHHGQCRDRSPPCPPARGPIELWTTRVQSVFLDTFGRPDPNQDPPCERTERHDRGADAAPDERPAAAPASDVATAAGPPSWPPATARPIRSSRRLYLLVYSRLPDEAERDIGRAIVRRKGNFAAAGGRRPDVGAAEHAGVRVQGLNARHAVRPWTGRYQENDMTTHRNCEGITRRDCLQLGLGGLLGRRPGRRAPRQRPRPRSARRGRPRRAS